MRTRDRSRLLRLPTSVPRLAITLIALVASFSVAMALDVDNDGVPDDFDNCFDQYNPSQIDADGDGSGDACDNCPADSGSPPNGSDLDGDGVGDACDLCPAVISPSNGDADDDGAGNECDNCPEQFNPDQFDGDFDGVGDACDENPGPDNPRPFLVAPGKTSILVGRDPPDPQDRILAVTEPVCQGDNGYHQFSCATPEGEAACLALPAACLPAVILSTVEIGQREDIQNVFFEFSLDGVFWNPVGPAIGPFPIGPEPEDLGNVPPYRSHGLARTGFWAPFFVDPPLLDQFVLVRTVMQSNAGAIGTDVKTLYIDDTPPVPIFTTLAPLDPVAGLVSIDLFSPDEDVQVFEISLKVTPESEKGVKFDQPGLGSEEQRKVGPNAPNGSNNFCGPTAAKNALHRLATSNTGLFPNQNADRNLQMAKLLSKKMKTGTSSGTLFTDFVSGMRDYLKERNLGCDNPAGYTATSYVHKYKKNTAGTGWAPATSGFSWDDYEKEMRDGEAVTLLILPWDNGGDAYGTANDSIGYGHYITGKDGQKNGEGAGMHSFSFVDPDDGKAGDLTWQDRGGFPSVNYNGSVWIVHGFVAVSPKIKPFIPLDLQPAVPNITGSVATMTFDTAPFSDGIYILEARGIDGFGNLGRAIIPIEIDNVPDVCFDTPDADNDGVRDDCDNCPAAQNAVQDDLDGDGVGDACDACPLDPAITDFTSCPDLDEDGRGDCCDLCPGLQDPVQNDTDDDQVGDLCDNCDLVPNPAQDDGDQDGVGDACDQQPGFDPVEPFLIAPAKTSRWVGRDYLLPPELDRRLVVPEQRCDVPIDNVDDLCSDSSAVQTCTDNGGVCRPWVRLVATDLTERDEQVASVTFLFSIDGDPFIPIGTDFVRDDPPPPVAVGTCAGGPNNGLPCVTDGDCPVGTCVPEPFAERNRADARGWGWTVDFYDPPLDLPVQIQIQMEALDLVGVPNLVDEFFDVVFTLTPPLPIPQLEPLQPLSGVVTIPVEINDPDASRLELHVLVDEKKNREKKFDQEGLGSEDQNKVGPDTDEGTNNYCGPTAAKNALHRLAEKDKRIYNEETAADRNLKMAKKLAEKMGTGTDTGTGWGDFVGGIRKYLAEEKVGCKEDDGYTVTEYIHEYETKDEKTRPTKSKFSWDDYEKEMRAGEAVTLLLVPWNAGTDGDYGTADDSVGFGHYVTGKDGEKNEGGKGKHEFSYVDPGDGKAGETTWEDRGGFPSVTYGGGVWLVAGFVAVSPKQREEETTADTVTVGTSRSTELLTLDTTLLEDGIYDLFFYGFDAAGNAAKFVIPVLIDNAFDVCPGDPGLPDTDLDFVKDPCDNCVLTPNLDQADFDFDGSGDACDTDDDDDGVADAFDCVALDESVWAEAGDAQSLLLGTDKDTFSWAPPLDPGGTQPLRYDLVVSPDATTFVGAACGNADVAGTTVTNPATPLPGDGLYWLVRAENDCGGTLGVNSDSVERPGSPCP